MAWFGHFVATVILAASYTLGQTPLAVMPTVSDAVKEIASTAGVQRFVRLWEYALRVDGQGPGLASRINIEAKTIFAPNGIALLNMIPLDSANPLYGNSVEIKALRSTFLKDHMVLDPIFPTCHDLTKKDGVKALTFSGKDVHIRKDEKGNIFVEDAPVKEVLSLDDGTQLYVLNKLLFDNFQKVRNIFNTRAASELAGPTGPPLDIDGTGSVPHSEDGNPASPTNDFGPVGPPAPPSAGFVGIEPPAPPPPELLGVRAPAPPPGFPAVGLPQDEPARFAVTVLPPAPPRTQESDSRIIFPSPEGERFIRTLEILPFDDFRDLDPVLQGDASDLAFPEAFFFSSSSLFKENGYSGRTRPLDARNEQRQSENNRPLDELSSIEQFATLFELSSSPSDSIVRVLQEAGLVTMLGLLETSGFLRQLVTGEEGPFIVLVPTEEAFSQLSRQALYELARENDLAYHIIPLRGQRAPKISNDDKFSTLLGPKLRFNVYGGSTYVNGVPITHGDQAFSYGTIQTVNSVLKPHVGDIRGVLVNSGHPVTRINTLLTVVRLPDQGVYTIMAPPDSAISSKGYAWPGLLMQRELAKNLLDRHILKGTWYSDGLLQERTMRTLAGTSITFRRDADGTVTANGIPIRTSNLSATNGVVHLVADVIPDCDLGSDPTTIPNPLIASTESPLYLFGRSPSSEIPTISGLYELPGQDPFQDFIPLNSQPADPFEYESTPLPYPVSDSYITHDQTPFEVNTDLQNTTQISGTTLSEHKTYNYHDGIHATSHQDSKPYVHDISVDTPVNTELLSFLDMLERTVESIPGEEETNPQSLLLAGTSNSSITDIGDSTSLPFSEALPHLSHRNTVLNISPLPLDQLGLNSQLNFGTESNDQVLNFRDQLRKSEVNNPNLELIDTAIKPERAVSDPVIITTTLDLTTENFFHSILQTLINGSTSYELTDQQIPSPVISERTDHELKSQQIPLLPVVLESPDYELSGQHIPSLPVNFGSDYKLTSQQIPITTVVPELTDSEVMAQQTPTLSAMPESPFAWASEAPVMDKEKIHMNILALLQNLNLTKFAELIQISGLNHTLDFEGPWTVFAPSNEAIDAIPPKALEEIISNPRFLRRVVSYHVIPGKFLSEISFRPGIQLPTLHAGYTLVISYYSDGPVARWVAGGSTLSDLDEEASNGVVHILDQVLYAPYGNLVTTISLSPILTVFSKLIASDENLQRYLSASGPITIFVPQDESLQKITIPEDQFVRRAWILSHVVEGTWYSAGFSDTWPLISVNNDTLATTLSSNPDSIRINGIEVTYSDVTAANGVLHVIEHPLFSPT